MTDLSQRSLGSIVLLSLGLAAGAVTPMITSVPTSAQASFPDVEPNYWAQPFIQALAEKDIIAGYPDGTYRPDQPLDRDEFAAIIRQAFNQNQVREIPSGSVFKDVPAGYWAAPPIEEAYETGFMRGYSGSFFRPQEEVSRVEALVALMRGLNLSPGGPQVTINQATTATTNPATNQATTATTNPATNQIITGRRAVKKPLFIPLAITSLMQPLLVASANAQSMPTSGTTTSVARDRGVPPSDSASTVASGQGVSSSRPTESVTSDQSVSFNRPASSIVSNYYIDAQKIPQYAVEDVAAATKANIVVNYPNVRVLNPNDPLTRGAAAALIYQTLVYQGKIKPLSSSVGASNYIVGRSQTSNQATQTAP